MKQYASQEATFAALVGIGFTQLPATDAENAIFDAIFAAPGKDSQGDSLVLATVYECAAGYYCVTLDGEHAWSAPIVWNGPRASWDNSDSFADFRAYLDAHYKGWSSSGMP